MSDKLPDKIVVHTGLYSKKAYDILSRLRHNILYDYKKRIYGILDFPFVDFKFQPNGEVVLNITTKSRYIRHRSNIVHFSEVSFLTAILHNDHNSIKNWLRINLKRHINETLPPSMKDENYVLQDYSGTYYNQETQDYISNENITYKEVNCLCDILINKTNLYDLYSKEIIESLQGVERDPVLTELLIERELEYSKIENEYNQAVDKLKKECDDKQDELAEKYNNDIKNLQLSKQNGLNMLKENLNQMRKQLKLKYSTTILRDIDLE